MLWWVSSIIINMKYTLERHKEEMCSISDLSRPLFRVFIPFLSIWLKLGMFIPLTVIVKHPDDPNDVIYFLIIITKWPSRNQLDLPRPVPKCIVWTRARGYLLQLWNQKHVIFELGYYCVNSKILLLYILRHSRKAHSLEAVALLEFDTKVRFLYLIQW